MNQVECIEPIKRPRGRPRTGRMLAVFSRIPPELYDAVKNEAARRGTVPSALVREALDLLLKQASEQLAAA
jgi:hypothetical protein